MTKIDKLNSSMFSALRSIYRYKTLIKDSTAPDILLDREVYIMKSRLNKLSPTEIVDIMEAWEDFKKEQLISDAELDRQIDQDLKEFNKSTKD